MNRSKPHIHLWHLRANIVARQGLRIKIDLLQCAPPEIHREARRPTIHAHGKVLFTVGAREESLYVMIFRIIMQYARDSHRLRSMRIEVVNLTMGLVGAFGTPLRHLVE